jgi:hypothetical protein
MTFLASDDNDAQRDERHGRLHEHELDHALLHADDSSRDVSACQKSYTKQLREYTYARRNLLSITTGGNQQHGQG